MELTYNMKTNNRSLSFITRSANTSLMKLFLFSSTLSSTLLKVGISESILYSCRFFASCTVSTSDPQRFYSLSLILFVSLECLQHVPPNFTSSRPCNGSYLFVRLISRIENSRIVRSVVLCIVSNRFAVPFVINIGSSPCVATSNVGLSKAAHVSLLPPSFDFLFLV